MDDSEKSLLIELLQLAQDKQIPYTQSQLKKMSKERLEEVMHEYKLKELDNLNETLADVAIVKIEEYSKSFNLIKKSSQLSQKLKDRKLFKRDLKSMVAWVTPLLRYVGILEGAVVYGLEVFDKFAEKAADKNENKGNENDNTSSQTTQGDQQSASHSESDSNEN